MTCAFCELDGKLTKEHVWPRWVAPYLEHEGGPGTNTRTIIRPSGTESTSYKSRPANLTVKSVCPECNGGWMSQLEERAKPVLLPMIEGRAPVRLGSRDAETVATWAVKTALVSGSEFTPPAPREFYTELREARAPVGNVRVWIGRTPHLQAHSIDFRPMKVGRKGEDPPDRENGYQAVLSVGHLVLYVIGWKGPKPQLNRVFSHFGDTALVKVWPFERLVVWPPPATITLTTGLDTLAEALGEVA